MWLDEPDFSLLKLLLKKALILFALCAIIIGAIILILIGYSFKWTGFGWYQLPTNEWHLGKTLWDWMELLLVPVVLALGGYLWSSSQKKQERESVNNQLQDEALQSYLERITSLLSQGKITNSKKNLPTRQIVRAQTLTVFGILDGSRKALLVKFLYDAGMIEKNKVLISLKKANLNQADFVNRNTRAVTGSAFRPAHLENIDFDEVDLIDAKLQSANLQNASFYTANMTNCDLSYADLSNANLTGAILFKANLSNANLSHARLKGALLAGANLSGANFSGADLTGVWLTAEKTGWKYLGNANLSDTDFSGANLKGAKVQIKQLKNSILDKTVLPDGKVSNTKTTG